ncbi:MAG: hypothetical protein Q8P30_01260 [Candidatus Uhrbacteria bacterium]|nr:hypothetical protein [Candidatus Uhrbacteria bacterium]
MFVVTKYGRIELPHGSYEHIPGGPMIRIIHEIEEWDLQEGFILIRRDKGKYQQVYDIFSSLDDAFIACVVANVAYGMDDRSTDGGEIAKLTDIIVENRALVDDMDRWKVMSLEDRDLAKARIEALADEHGKVRAEHKKRMVDLTQGARGVEDSLGRVNPPATQCKLAYAAKDGVARIDDIVEISRYVGMRAFSLHAEIQRSLFLIRRVLKEIESLPVSVELSVREATRLSTFARELRVTHDRPFRHSFRHTADALDSVAHMIKHGSAKEAETKLFWTKWALRNMEKQRLLSDFRLRFEIVQGTRKADREERRSALLGELIALRARMEPAAGAQREVAKENGESVDRGNDLRYMRWVRRFLNRAIAEWRIKKWAEVRRCLSEASNNRF